MKKINKHIIIVRSSDKALSSMSQSSCDAIFTVLSENFTKVETQSVVDLSDLNVLVSKKPDLVFLGTKFIAKDADYEAEYSNIIWLSEFLDTQGIAYTGSNKKAHELEHNKPLAKSRILKYGLITSAFQVIKVGCKLTSSDVYLDFPLFVKPTNRGGGLGINEGSIINTYEQLTKQVDFIHYSFKSDVLVEKYLSGREFSVAILKQESSDDYLAMPIELIAPPDQNGSRVLSMQIKSADAEEDLLVNDETTKSLLSASALDFFKALGGRDYGRIDIRFDHNNTPHFLEANLIPSLISDYGSFPKACLKNISLSYEDMLMSIVNLGLKHSLREQQHFSLTQV